MDGESPYVLRIRGANKLKDTRGKAWEPQAYVIVSTLRREFSITIPGRKTGESGNPSTLNS